MIKVKLFQNQERKASTGHKSAEYNSQKSIFFFIKYLFQSEQLISSNATIERLALKIGLETAGLLMRKIKIFKLI